MAIFFAGTLLLKIILYCLLFFSSLLFSRYLLIWHTLENILQNGSFTLNHVTENFYKETHQCSARWEQSEFEATGLEEEYLNDFKAPFVKISPLKILKICEPQIGKCRRVTDDATDRAEVLTD